MLRSLTFAIAFAAAVPAQDMHRFTEEFKYSYKVNPGARISAESFNGAIDIESWDRSEVEITGRKYASSEDALRDIRIETSNAPEMVTVRVFRPKSDDSGWSRGGAGAKMTIRVPRKVQLDRVATSNGSVSIADVDGNARVTTSNGRIRVTNLTGRLEATTSNGGIEASGLTAASDLRTSNGPINATFPRFTNQDITASTSNGPITLRLPEGVNADLRATTSNGSVRSDYDVTTRGSIGKNRLEGRIGEGGASIRLNTSNGPIRIVGM
jgi:hypothetical protein